MLPNEDGNILPIIEHVFHCITHFSCQILSFNHPFILHTNRLKVDVDYIHKLDFFSRDFGSKCTTADNRRRSTVSGIHESYEQVDDLPLPLIWPLFPQTVLF